MADPPLPPGVQSLVNNVPTSPGSQTLAADSGAVFGGVGNFSINAFENFQAQNAQSSIGTTSTATGNETTIPLFKSTQVHYTPSPVNPAGPIIKGRPEFTAETTDRTNPGYHDYATRPAEGSMPTDVRYTESQAVTAFGMILTDQTLLRQWQQLALEAGWVNSDTVHNAASLASAWETAVSFAIKIKQSTGRDVTPFEAAKISGEATGAAQIARANDAAAHFTGTKELKREISVDSRPADGSYAFLSNALQRGATDAEWAAFQKGWAAHAQAHPETTVTSGTFKDGVQQTQTATQSGGFDRTKEMQDLADANPEVGAIQRATTYMDALRDALKAAF